MHKSMPILVATLSGLAAAQTPVQSPRPRPKLKPYAIVMSMTSTQVYANGMTSTRVTERINFRDEDGRMRTESEIPGTPPSTSVQDGRRSSRPGHEKFMMVDVFDPVDQASYNWNTDPTGTHEVTVRYNNGAPRRPPVQPPTKPADDAMVFESHTEQLGQRSLPGVVAEGRKITTRYPAGYQGVSQAYEVTSENWVVPSLNIQVAGTTDDPRFGKTVTTLVSFSDQPPDPALFKPPPGYKLMEMKPDSPAEKPATTP